MRRFALYTYTIQLICALLGYAIFKYALPQYYFSWYIVVPILFMILSLPVLLLPKLAKNSQKKTIYLIFTGKLMRSIIAFAFFGIYITLVNVQKQSFVITFMIFYFISLFIETLFLAKKQDIKHE